MDLLKRNSTTITARTKDAISEKHSLILVKEISIAAIPHLLKAQYANYRQNAYQLCHFFLFIQTAGPI